MNRPEPDDGASVDALPIEPELSIEPGPEPATSSTPPGLEDDLHDDQDRGSADTSDVSTLLAHPEIVNVGESGIAEPAPVGASLSDAGIHEAHVHSIPIEVDTPTFTQPPMRYRLAEAEEGYYRGRNVVGSAGILGTTTPTGVKRSRRGSRHRPDTIIDGFVVGDLRVAVASLRGMSHHVHRSNRQDSYSIGLTDDDSWVVIAIADGVSSGPLSEEAADAACEAAVRATVKALAAVNSVYLDWMAVSSHVRDAVRNRAEVLASRRGKDANTGQRIEAGSLSDATLARVMATTAEILIVSTQVRTNGGYDFARILISGDGSAFLLDPMLGVSEVGSGKSVGIDGLTSHAVRPLPFDVGSPEVSQGVLMRGQAITTMTDGFGGQFGDGMNAFGSHIFQTINRPLDIVAYLQAVSYINEGANDDRTIATVWALGGH